MRILICGGRAFVDRAAAFSILDAKHKARPITCVVEGGARGADTIAREWATSRRVLVETFWADWEKHGRAAGPIRNLEMLERGRPDEVIAFPGGRGTADMVRKASAAGIAVQLPLG